MTCEDKMVKTTITFNYTEDFFLLFTAIIANYVHYYIHLLYYNRLSVFEGIDTNKTNYSYGQKSLH